MPSLTSSIDFACKHLSAPDGEPFTTFGRDWLVDHIWRPLSSYKLWPVDPEALCDSCRANILKIVDNTSLADKSRTEKHSQDTRGCRGLAAEPQLIVAAKLKRQSGKTMGTAGWIFPRIFLDEHESVVLLAGSEDQATRIYNDNYKAQFKRNPALAAHATVQRNKIVVPGKKSELVVVPTTITSVGGSYTVVIIDECRVVPPAVAVAMLPTIFARGGWQCPDYHVRTHGGVEDVNAPRVCTVCKKTTVPWYGRALLLSSASELRDNDSDWFEEFVTHYTAHPHPNVYVYESSETINPKASKKVIDTVADVFGALESTRDYAHIETANESVRRGTPFLSETEIKKCIDYNLLNSDCFTGRCVGFLDTSLTQELTSLVIVAEDERSTSPWDMIKMIRLDVWDPKVLPGRAINAEQVEKHLAVVLAAFSGLKTLAIDTRAMPWAIEMFYRLLKKFRNVRRWDKAKSDESQAGWRMLSSRILSRPPKITLMDSPAMLKEFRGLRLKLGANDSAPKVVDQNRTKSHKDITEALAICCWLVGKEQMKSTAGVMSRCVRLSGNKSGIATSRSLAGNFSPNNF